MFVIEIDLFLDCAYMFSSCMSFEEANGGSKSNIVYRLSIM